MKILVITSCTSSKQDCEVPAVEMYTGAQHRLLMEGLEQVRARYKEEVIDLYIISAGYGLLNESDVIAPYNVTFTGLNKKKLLARSNSLQLHEQVEALIAHYDFVFFLLGEKYIRALQLPFEGSDTGTQIFLLGKGYRKLIPDASNTHFVPVGNDLARELGVMGVALKGFVFRQLCVAVCREGLQIFEEVRKNPQRILDVVLANR